MNIGVFCKVEKCAFTQISADQHLLLFFQYELEEQSCRCCSTQCSGAIAVFIYTKCDRKIVSIFEIVTLCIPRDSYVHTQIYIMCINTSM